MRQHLALPLMSLTGLVLLGCATVRPGAAGIPDTTERAAVIELTPQLQEARRVQAIKPVYKASHIASLSVTPYVQGTIGGTTKYWNIDAATGLATDSTTVGILRVSQASPDISFARKIRLANLKPSKNYQIIARAYDVDNVQISTDPSSTVNLTVGTSASPILGTIPVKLKDTTFAATASVRVILNGDATFPDTLLTRLFTVTGQGATEVTGATASLPAQLALFSLTNLSGSTTYRVEVEARRDGDFVASGSTEIQVGEDDVLPGATVSIDVPPG